MSFFSKLKKAVGFENFGVKRLIKGVKKNPLTLFTGPARTPLDTKIYNTLTGSKLKPLTNQLGGHSASAYAEYGKDPGYAPQLNQIAGTIAGMYGGSAVGSLAGSAAGSAGASSAVAGRVGSLAGRGALAAANSANQAGATSSPENTSGFTGGPSMPNQPNNSTYTGRDAWFVNAANDALGRASTLADRPYEAYGGERVAGLSGNEQQAGGIAAGMGSQLTPYTDRLKSGFSTEALAPYMNPYTDAVLGARTREIGNEFGRQSASLDRNAAATDAFRTGRTDLARARLGASRTKAIDDATNQVKSDAFNAGTSAFFNQGSQDLNTIGALSNADSAQIGALNTTGGAERGVRQANNDFNYGQFLERRDWSMNNLNSLLSAIQSVSPAAGSLTKTKGPNTSASDYAAIAGTIASAVGEYYKPSGGGSTVPTDHWTTDAANAGG